MSGDPHWSNVTLLTSWDGPGIGDNPTNRPAQWDNRLTLSTAEKRFGASSLALPGLEGAGVVYSGGGSDVGDLGPDDFTIEFFFQREYSGSRVDYLVSSRLSDGVHGYSWGLLVDDQDRLIWRGDVRGAADVVLWGTPDWPPGWWKHIAVTRSGGTLRCFIDGVQTYSGTGSANYRSPHPVFVGFNGTLGGTWPNGTRNGACRGFVDELRVTAGVARYTSNFAPPTAAFPTTQGSGGGGGSATDPYWNDVLLYLPMIGDNDSTTFTDYSSSPKPVTRGGGAKISTTQKKYGGASAYLDGTGWLDVAGLPADLLSGNFTIEGWVYLTGQPQQTFFNTSPHTVLGVSLNRDGTGRTLLLIGNGNGWIESGTSDGTLEPNVWHHIAVVRSGSNMVLYHNGTAQLTLTATPANMTGARVGDITFPSPERVNGYIDDFRITKAARYSGTFTPPIEGLSGIPVTPGPVRPAIRGNWNFDFRAKVSPETRKDLPPPAAKNFPDRVREEVSTLLGKRGDALDKAVTVRDLVDGGIIQVRPGWQGGTSPVGGFGPAFPQPVEAYEPDLTPPPAPTNFTASAGFGLVYLQTDSPAFTMGHGYARTKVYGAKRAQGAQAPVFSDAVLVYEFTGTIGAMPSDPATTWHLWAKWRTKDGVDSAAPAGGTNGVVATTGQDPGVIIDALTGQITEEMLYVDLSNRINLIDGPASLTNSVAARLAAEATARGAAISQESTTRQTQVDSLSQQISTITAGGGGNAAAIQAEITARTNADSALSSRIDTVVAQTGTNTAAIQTEVTARTNADSAMAAQIAVLQAASGNSEAIVNLTNLVNAKSANFVQGTAPTATKVNDLWIDTTNGGNLLKRWNGTAWVLADDARIGATASSVLTLQSAVSDPATGLTSKVSALEVSAGTQASQITGLKAQYTVKIDLNGYVAGFGLAANAPNDSGATSSFSVRADRFYVGPPTNYSQEATPSGATAGQIWYRPSDKKFFAWSGTAWEPWKNSLPFIVQTTPQTINGVNVPAGVYMDTAFIKDATISSAMIANLTADKITAGYVSAALGVEGSIFAGNKFYIGGVAEYIFDPQNPARKTGILRVTNANVALDTDGAVFHVNSFKITQGSALTTATPFEVDGNGNVKIKNAYIGTITAGQINSNGLTIKSTSGATLLDATLNTPPWVVFVDSLVSAGSGGAELVAPTTSSTNTRYIKSLKAGHGVEFESSAEQVTIKATGSEIDSGAMGVAVNVTGVAPVNGLSVTLQANSVYRLTATIRFRGTSATTPTPVFGLRLPSGASGTAQVTAQVGSVSAAESRIINWPPGGDGTATFSAIGAAGAGNQIATIDAVLTTGATGDAASVLAGSGNGISITIDTASAMFAQKIRRVTQPANTALATPAFASVYQAIDERQSDRLPAPLSSAYIALTFKTDGTWQIRGSGSEMAPWADGSWLNPSGVVNSGAAWELMVTVGGSPSAGITINNDTIINGQPGFVPVSGDRAISINAVARDTIVTGLFPISVVARRVGETTTPAAWATFTFEVRAESISTV